MSILNTFGLSSMLISIDNNRERENYFINKIEPNLSIRDIHFLRESYSKLRECNISEMKPSELYAKGLLKKGEFGYEINYNK